MNRQFFSNLRRGQVLFGRFCLKDVVNAVDQGAVYLCADCQDGGRPVALKVASTAALRISVQGDRFENELLVQARVSHPNVVRCYDFFQDESFTAFSMEYLAGGTLAGRMHGRSGDIWGVVELGTQLAAGLEAIHKAGILHRDLKPENILLDSDGTPHIADFGIAAAGTSIFGGEDDVLQGTLSYLSPEYIRSGYFDARSDLYALGLILYQIIAGMLPQEGSSPLEMLIRRAAQDLPPLNEVCPYCPGEVARVIDQAVARDPRERFQSVAQLRIALEWAQQIRSHTRYAPMPGARGAKLRNLTRAALMDSLSGFFGSIH